MKAMRLLPIICVLMISARVIHAQESAPEVVPGPLPPGKLLESAPEFAKWTIRITVLQPPPSTKVKPPVDTPDQAPPPPPRRVVVVKTGSVRHLTGVDNEGATLELWIQGTTEAILAPGREKPLLYGAHDGVDPYYTRFTRTDFPGFQWISPHNYLGIAKRGDRPCLVFQDKVVVEAPHDELGSPVEAMAYIDLVTRLPVCLRENGEESIYAFDDPPTEPLVVPQNVTDAVNARQKHIQELTRMPGRPY